MDPAYGDGKRWSYVRTGPREVRSSCCESAEIMVCVSEQICGPLGSPVKTRQTTREALEVPERRGPVVAAVI